MEASEFLYHYTSIESLALILKNRTIRLNPLDKMDDLQEQRTADVENIGKFVFVSSWTADSIESIPMWRMYANPSSGVRIKLRKNPFAWHENYVEDIANIAGLIVAPDSAKMVRTFLDLSDMMERGYMSAQAMTGNILEQVQYTNDTTKLEPRITTIGSDQLGLNIGTLGKYKNKYWEFQKEWRYILAFMPMDFKNGIEVMRQRFGQSLMRIAKGIEPPPFRFYDLEIEPRFFEEMEIVGSPQMTAGNRVILETLVEKYNPNAIIKNSELMNLI